MTETKATYETIQAVPEDADQIRDASHDHAYFSMMPNCLDDWLDPYQYRLYAHYKRVCGETGKCWQSTATTAAACKMSVGKVSAAKQELYSMRLIDIEQVPRPAGGRAYHRITITDIWQENILHCSPSSQGEQPSSYSELASSPGELKKTPLKEDPSEEEREGATAPHASADDSLWPKDVAAIGEEKTPSANPADAQRERMRAKFGDSPVSVGAHCQEQQAKEGTWTVPTYSGLSSACAAYRRVYEFSPKKYQRKTIDEHVSPDEHSIQLWEEVCQAWADLGWSPVNVKGMLDYYVTGQMPTTKPKGNGRHDRTNGGKPSHIVTEEECLHLTDEQEAEYLAAYEEGRGDAYLANLPRV
jgi:hypothetical protein